MQLRFIKTLENNIYQIQIVPENYSQGELALMEKYGEPTIETGGTGSLSPAYEFPTDPRDINSGFPFTRSISAEDDAQAEAKMNNWQTEMTTAFTNAMATLRSLSDTFTNIVVETI